MNRPADEIRSAGSFVPEFGPSGALRQPVGKLGRVHVDRWLPFIILNRGGERTASLARRIAVESPSYLVWPAENDSAALEVVRKVVAAMASRAGRLLVISLDDRSVEYEVEGSPVLPDFAAELGAGDKGDVGRAANALETAMRAITVDLRRCKVERVPFAPLLPRPFDQALNAIDGVNA